MKRIMIVDDIQFTRYTLRNILEPAGYDIVGEADDGKKAIRLYNQLMPDVVLLDIQMPSMGGIETLKEIVKINPNVKVIMVSGLCTEEIVTDVALAGAKGFIVKPFREETVLTIVKKMFPQE